MFIFFFFALKVRYSSLSFVRLLGIETGMNLQLTGKGSLKFNFNSSLLLEYDCKITKSF